MSDRLAISSLLCYPVKSCGAIHLSSAVLTPTGLLFDRTWVVVKPKGRFLTQRQQPRMALIAASLWPAALMQGEDPSAHPDAALVLHAPGMPELRVPLNPVGDRTLVDASVWEWRGQAWDEGQEAADWLSACLGQPLRLVRYAGTPGASEPLAGDSTRRHANRDFSPEGHEVAFADGFPVLLATEASLADLNSHMGQAVPMDRFRPNIVVSGGAAWDEDAWEAVRVGTVDVLNVKPCSRCTIPNIDQATATAAEEPMQTLKAVRSGTTLGWTDPPSFKNSIFFGVNLVVTAAGGGAVRVGDAVEVMTRRQGPPLPPHK